MQHVEEELAHAAQRGAKLQRTIEQKQAERAKEKRVPWPMQRRCALRSPKCRTPRGSPAVRMRLHRVVGVGRRTAALQAAHYIGKVTVAVRAVGRGLRRGRAGRCRRPSTDGCSSVSSMRSTHEAERLSATPTPLVGCTHDSVLVRAATAAWHCSRLGGAQQLGEGRGALPGPVRVVHKTLCLCAAGDAGRVRRCLGEARVAALPSARPAALDSTRAARVWGTAVPR